MRAPTIRGCVGATAVEVKRRQRNAMVSLKAEARDVVQIHHVSFISLLFPFTELQTWSLTYMVGEEKIQTHVFLRRDLLFLGYMTLSL